MGLGSLACMWDMVDVAFAPLVSFLSSSISLSLIKQFLSSHTSFLAFTLPLSLSRWE